MDKFLHVRARTAGLDPQASKKQCRRGEEVFLIAILQTQKTVTEKVNNLSKINNNGVVTELDSWLWAGVFLCLFLRDKGYLLVA